MTPQFHQRFAERQRPPRALIILGLLIPIAAAAAEAARVLKGVADNVETRSHAESLYVRRDSSEIRHLSDSLNLNAKLDALTTGVNQLVRVCQRKGDCP